MWVRCDVVVTVASSASAAVAWLVGSRRETPAVCGWRASCRKAVSSCARFHVERDLGDAPQASCVQDLILAQKPEKSGRREHTDGIGEVVSMDAGRPCGGCLVRPEQPWMMTEPAPMKSAERRG